MRPIRVSNQITVKITSQFYLEVLIFLALFLLPACSPASSLDVPTTGAVSPIALQTGGTETPVPLCAPPLCGSDQVYHCPDECPGGCGTECATRTPEYLPTQPPQAEVIPNVSIPVSVQDFPDADLYFWELVVEGLAKPLGLTHAGDGSNRLFILEQPGTIRIVTDGILLPSPFLDIRDRVLDRNNEQGLLGLAFHPGYEQNGIFFVNYTARGADTLVSAFYVSPDPNTAEPASERILLRIPQPYANHNGGHLLFGPDGYLYIGTGDGGSAGDPQGNAQNPDSLLGKILRIDIEHGELYAIPGDNPYANGGGRPEIWATGLRNPWRFAFDRVTGDLYIGDVGQNQWEEVDFLPAGHPGGANFGWDYWEGTHPFEGSPPHDVAMIAPIWEYDHSLGCSITGGVTYQGSDPNWQGIYLYGDYCSGTIWGLLEDGSGTWVNRMLFQTGANITAFGEDQAGEVYRVDRDGKVYGLTKKP